MEWSKKFVQEVLFGHYQSSSESIVLLENSNGPVKKKNANSNENKTLLSSDHSRQENPSLKSNKKKSKTSKIFIILIQWSNILAVAGAEKLKAGFTYTQAIVCARELQAFLFDTGKMQKAKIHKQEVMDDESSDKEDENFGKHVIEIFKRCSKMASTNDAHLESVHRAIQMLSSKFVNIIASTTIELGGKIWSFLVSIAMKILV